MALAPFLAWRLPLWQFRFAQDARSDVALIEVITCTHTLWRELTSSTTAYGGTLCNANGCLRFALAACSHAASALTSTDWDRYSQAASSVLFLIASYATMALPGKPWWRTSTLRVRRQLCNALVSMMNQEGLQACPCWKCRARMNVNGGAVGCATS
jgi:hypothetical protein